LTHALAVDNARGHALHRVVLFGFDRALAALLRRLL
jgi:hypothetical protein